MLFYAPRATDMSKTLTEFGEAVDVLSNVFAGIYFVEFVIKITGLGPRQYFRYKWNLFDFFLVVVQVCTSVSTAAAYLGGGEYLTLNLSYIRSMRVLRLARYSRSVRQLLLTLLFGMPDLINILGVVYVMLYVFSIAGMTRFSKPLFSSLL